MTDETSPEDVEMINFDGSTGSFISLIIDSKIGLQGEVSLCFIGDSSLQTDTLANWQAAFEQIANPHGGQLYVDFRCLLPPAQQLDDEKIGEFVVPSAFTVHRLPTSEEADLHRTLIALPEGTAICIFGIETIRSAISEDEGGNPVVSWTGSAHRHRTVAERYGPHLRSIARCLLEAAKQRRLFILALCRLPGPVSEVLNDLLPDNPGLSVLWLPASKVDQINHKLEAILRMWREREATLPDLLAQIDDLPCSPANRALARSQLLDAAEIFEAAWLEVEPYLDTYREDSADVRLHVAHLALSTMRREKALAMLRSALATPISTFGGLQSAYMLAKDLRETSVCAGLLTRMEEEFPSEQATLEIRYAASCAARDYIAAGRAATKLGWGLEAEMCSAFAKPTLELSSLEDRARQEERLDWFHVCVAREYAHRGDFDLSAHMARQVPIESRLASAAIRVRIRALVHGMLGCEQPNEDDVAELEQVMNFVATHPQDHATVNAFDALFEDSLTEFSASVFLGVLLERLRTATNRFGAPLASLTTPEASTVEAATAFLKEIFPVIGKTHWEADVALPESFEKWKITPDLIDGVLRVIEMQRPSSEDLSFGLLLLKTVRLMCLEANEPHRDIVAARLLVGQFAAAGHLQAARHIAVAALAYLPLTQPSHYRWRLGLTWAVYSESYARTGHATAAWRYLCVAVAAFGGEVLDPREYCKVLRLGVVILRDVGIVELAASCLKIERDVRAAFCLDEEAWQLDQVELSLRVKTLQSRRDLLKTFLESLRQLRALPEGYERWPVVSLAVSLFRQMRLEGVGAPAAQVELSMELSGKDDRRAKIFGYLLHGQISRDELLSLIQSSSNAVRLDDLAAQQHQIQIIAEDALDHACDSNDADLFLVAASVFCQPVLSLESDSERSDTEQASESFRRWAVGSLGTVTDQALVRDRLSMVQRLGPPEEYSLLETCRITSAQLCSVIGDDEGILLAVKGARGLLCTGLFLGDGRIRLRILPPEIWSTERYAEWVAVHPRGYARTAAPGKDGRSEDEIRQSLAGLTLGIKDLPSRLTLIPAADLFGFPFALTSTDRGFLGQEARLSQVPSAAWLLRVRQQPPVQTGPTRAWLGSPRSVDPTIVDARTYIAPNLRGYGVDVLADDEPSGLAGSRIAIVLSHGSHGDAREFRGVFDGLEAHASTSIANALVGCSEVVLIVCYGAQTMVPINTNETRGLIRDLFAAAVRTVIASSWTVTLGTAAYWLPTYLKSRNAGQSCSEAAAAACDAVKRDNPDPGAWSSLQVFGDNS